MPSENQIKEEIREVFERNGLEVEKISVHGFPFEHDYRWEVKIRKERKKKPRAVVIGSVTVSKIP